MASQDSNLCNFCHVDDAVTWCKDCELFLCAECKTQHKKSTSFKHHKTMSIKDYNKLPKFMLDISSECRDHKKKLKLYCSSHDCPCCGQCINDKHKKCQEMQQLSDVVKKVKSSASVHIFEKDLNDMKENFDEIIEYLKSRMETSNIQKQKAAEQIRSIRESIDDYLNKIEKEIMVDLESKQSRLKQKINTLLQQLTRRSNEIKELQNEFSKMTKYATELHMYLGLREIEKITSKAAKYIDDLKSGGNLEEKSIEVFISTQLQSILEDVKSFGDININTSPFPLRLNAGRKDQAQDLVQTISDNEQFKPSMSRQLVIPEDRNDIVTSTFI